MKIEPDRWFYVSATWKNGLGLKLYLDGKEVASDDQGKEIQLPFNTNKPNVCFGADVKGASQFAKFTLSLFSTFNTFLSPSMMRSVYTFFFRKGKHKFKFFGIKSEYAISIVTTKDWCKMTVDISWRSTLMAIPLTDIGHFVTITRRNISS